MDDEKDNIAKVYSKWGLGETDLVPLEQMAKEDLHGFTQMVLVLDQETSVESLRFGISALLGNALETVSLSRRAKLIAEFLLHVEQPDEIFLAALVRAVHQMHVQNAGEPRQGDYSEVELILLRPLSRLVSRVIEPPSVELQELFLRFFLFLEQDDKHPVYPVHEDKKDPVRSQMQEWIYKAVRLWDLDMILRLRKKMFGKPAWEVLSAALVSRWGASEVVDCYITLRGLRNDEN